MRTGESTQCGGQLKKTLRTTVHSGYLSLLKNTTKGKDGKKANKNVCRTVKHQSFENFTCRRFKVAIEISLSVKVWQL